MDSRAFPFRVAIRIRTLPAVPGLLLALALLAATASSRAATTEAEANRQVTYRGSSFTYDLPLAKSATAQTMPELRGDATTAYWEMHPEYVVFKLGGFQATGISSPPTAPLNASGESSTPRTGGGTVISALLALALLMLAGGFATRTGSLYWAAAGAIMGLGSITIFSIGLPLFLLAAALVLLGFKRFGSGRLGVTLVGMGVAPAFTFTYDYLTADRSTVWFPDGYLIIPALFLAISIIGAVLGLIEMRRHKADTG